MTDETMINNFQKKFCEYTKKEIERNYEASATYVGKQDKSLEQNRRIAANCGKYRLVSFAYMALINNGKFEEEKIPFDEDIGRKYEELKAVAFQYFCKQDEMNKVMKAISYICLEYINIKNSKAVTSNIEDGPIRADLNREYTKAAKKADIACKFLSEVAMDLNYYTMNNYVDCSFGKMTAELLTAIYSRLLALFKSNLIPKMGHSLCDKVWMILRKSDPNRFRSDIKKMAESLYYRRFEPMQQFALENYNDLTLTLPLQKFDIAKNKNHIESFKSPYNLNLEPLKILSVCGNYIVEATTFKLNDEVIIFDCESIVNMSRDEEYKFKRSSWSKRLDEAIKLIPSTYNTIREKLESISEAQVKSFLSKDRSTINLYVKTCGFGVGTSFVYKHSAQKRKAE
jgi:hypothetical protein